MPYYPWTDKKTGKTVEIKRKMAEINVPPDKSETIDIMSIEEYVDAEWERGVSAAPHIGEKGKGRW